jgi:hypothetical protein
MVAEYCDAKARRAASGASSPSGLVNRQKTFCVVRSAVIRTMIISYLSAELHLQGGQTALQAARQAPSWAL